MAAEATHVEKKKEKEIEAQASIGRVVSRTKSKEGGKLGKFMKKCAKICKQPSKVGRISFELIQLRYHTHKTSTP
jgi:predicted GNAT family N-acyltransferase